MTENGLFRLFTRLSSLAKKFPLHIWFFDSPIDGSNRSPCLSLYRGVYLSSRSEGRGCHYCRYSSRERPYIGLQQRKAFQTNSGAETQGLFSLGFWHPVTIHSPLATVYFHHLPLVTLSAIALAKADRHFTLVTLSLPLVTGH